MEKVWLASLYYVDDKLDGCSAATERMFTRLLGFCGNAETGGKLPKNPWNLVGLPNGKPQVIDLMNRGVLRPLSNGGYEFPAWSGWQESGDKLAERRRKDRERKRRTRGTSADTSAEFHEQEERRGEERRSGPDKRVSHVSDTHADELPLPPEPPVPDWEPEHTPTTPVDVPAVIEMASRPTRTARATPAELTFIRTHVGTRLPHDVEQQLAGKARTLIRDHGAPPVEAALREWAARDGSPGLLPHLVADQIKRNRSPANISKADMWTTSVINPTQTVIEQQRRELE